ncbi:MAG TPA: Sua5/YciO/YrdC/YwlC family protein [Solimonas sp.]|nr:Sua5/YciO/YrdC/YwlC family protein [Solimonas sp.]
MDVSPLQLKASCRALQRGGVIAYPTEAVWGLGCEPLNQLACLRLLEMKRREWHKGLILVASRLEQLTPFVEAPSKNAMKRATATWPGPATWVFPATDHCPMWISGDQDGVAVRVSSHPVIQALCEAYGGPIVSTSANTAGRPPAMTPAQVRLYFGEDLDYLLPGALGHLAKPTTIRDVATGHILRR